MQGILSPQLSHCLLKTLCVSVKPMQSKIKNSCLNGNKNFLPIVCHLLNITVHRLYYIGICCNKLSVLSKN